MFFFPSRPTDSWLSTRWLARWRPRWSCGQARKCHREQLDLSASQPGADGTEFRQGARHRRRSHGPEYRGAQIVRFCLVTGYACTLLRFPHSVVDKLVIDRSISHSFDWLIDLVESLCFIRLIDWLIEGLLLLLFDWLIDWSIQWRISDSVDWLIDWLIWWHMFCSVDVGGPTAQHFLNTAMEHATAQTGLVSFLKRFILKCV